MHLTITTLDDRIMNVEVSEDLEIENLKAQCEFELGVPSANIVLTWEGRPLYDEKMTLKAYGIKNGDMLLLQQMRGQQQQMSPPQAAGSGMGKLSELFIIITTVTGPVKKIVARLGLEPRASCLPCRYSNH